MIITQKKPIDELMAMLGDAQKIAILGCGSCATACATGGEKEVAELKAYLESKGKTVVATNMADYCCMNMGVKTAMKKLNAGRTGRRSLYVLRRRRAGGGSHSRPHRFIRPIIPCS